VEPGVGTTGVYFWIATEQFPSMVSSEFDQSVHRNGDPRRRRFEAGPPSVGVRT